MSMEFGWWARDPDGSKFQVRATLVGQRLTWTRKQGHHQPWEPYGPPTDEDWGRLFDAAGNRLARRLLSPKQLAAIKRLRPG